MNEKQKEALKKKMRNEIELKLCLAVWGHPTISELPADTVKEILELMGAMYFDGAIAMADYMQKAIKELKDE